MPSHLILSKSDHNESGSRVAFLGKRDDSRGNADCYIHPNSDGVVAAPPYY